MIFIIQACRGYNAQKPVEFDSRGSKSKQIKPTPRPVPPTADYFFAYSTAPGTQAVRKPGGSLYIQLLCETLKKYASKLSLYKMMLVVHDTMADVENMYSHPETRGVKCCQMGEIVSSLRKKVHFK